MGWRRQRGLSSGAGQGRGCSVGGCSPGRVDGVGGGKQSPSQEADQRFEESGGLRVKVPLLSYSSSPVLLSLPAT